MMPPNTKKVMIDLDKIESASKEEEENPFQAEYTSHFDVSLIEAENAAKTAKNQQRPPVAPRV